MKIDSAWTTEIKTGDMIIIAFNNAWLDIGFFLGRGQGNSIQYYTINRLSNWLGQVKNGGKRKVPFKNFYNTHHPTKIARYSPDFLSPEIMVEYEKAIEALKLLKIIKE